MISTGREWLHGWTPVLHQDASGRQGCAVSGQLMTPTFDNRATAVSDNLLRKNGVGETRRIE